MLERSHSLPLEAMSGHPQRDDSPATRLPAGVVPLSHSTPDLSPLGTQATLGQLTPQALTWGFANDIQHDLAALVAV